ncbi:MAG TPA: hypothetical protein G4N90_04830 [Dehalococcoidia bacterium]|jgi:hypothetical protein|nr:hypothetical protein [Dehalococcoidia bacterium]
MSTGGLIFGILGGICAVLGGLTAGGVIPILAGELTWMFWLVLAGVLLLVAVVFNTGGKGEY